MAGSLYVRVSVSDLDMPHPENGMSWLRAYQRKELIFYTAVLRDEARYLECLSALPDLADIEVKTLSVGSLVIQMQCHTQGALQRLEKLYRKRDLNRILNQVLVTEELMEEMGVQNLALDTIIEPADFERCRRELNLVEIDSRIHQERGLNLEEVNVEESQFMSRVDCVTSFAGFLKEQTDHVIAMEGRYQNISTHRNEFLMTLKLAKPVDVKEFCSLDNLISVHRYLRASPSVGKSVQTGLVTDFLSIVNLSRLKLSDIVTKVKSCERHVLKYADKALLDDFYLATADATAVLDPGFNFADVPQDGSTQLGIMDGTMFGNLVVYMPHVLRKLHLVTTALKAAADKLSMTPESAEGSLSDVNTLPTIIESEQYSHHSVAAPRRTSLEQPKRLTNRTGDIFVPVANTK